MQSSLGRREGLVMQYQGRDRVLLLCGWRDRRDRRMRDCLPRYACRLHGMWDLPSERDYRHLRVKSQSLQLLNSGESLTDMWRQGVEDGVFGPNAEAIGIGERFVKLVLLVTFIVP
jgi:hypothetical protein